jgi:3-hydroxyisobutyrate dehydrogenase
LAEQLYQSVAAQGYARLGTHSLMLALAQMSAVDWLTRDQQEGELGKRREK